MLSASAAPPAERLCAQELQDFVDCVYVHSRCVQSGQGTVWECLSRRDADNQPAKDNCRRLWLGYLQCRRHIVDTRQRLR